MKPEREIRLCVCVPTYNRAECVERMLREEIGFFQDYGIDCRVYDSSASGETRAVVERYIRNGYRNLSYQAMDSKLHSSEKAFRIWREMGGSAYDYIWLIHDHTVCLDGRALGFIKRKLAGGYDFCLLNLQSSQNGAHEFADLDQFLLAGAWPLNSFGASIVRVGTFLRAVDWKRMEEKYLTPRTRNYAHIGFYYEQAARMPDFRAVRLELRRESFTDFLRNEKTSWDGEAVRICTECWGSVIHMLPEVYRKKDEALRTQDRGFLSVHKLIFYKRSGQYHLAAFLKYRKWLARIRPEDYWKDFLVACLPFAAARRLFCGKILRQVRGARRRKTPVAVFGAGRRAVECGDLLARLGAEYDAFLVTSKAGNPETLLGHPVFEAEAYVTKRPCFVFVAVLTSGAAEVAGFLDSFREKGCQVDYAMFE